MNKTTDRPLRTQLIVRFSHHTTRPQTCASVYTIGQKPPLRPATLWDYKTEEGDPLTRAHEMMVAEGYEPLGPWDGSAQSTADVCAVRDYYDTTRKAEVEAEILEERRRRVLESLYELFREHKVGLGFEPNGQPMMVFDAPSDTIYRLVWGSAKAHKWED